LAQWVNKRTKEQNNSLTPKATNAEGKSYGTIGLVYF